MKRFLLMTALILTLALATAAPGWAYHDEIQFNTLSGLSAAAPRSLAGVLVAAAIGGLALVGLLWRRQRLA